MERSFDVPDEMNSIKFPEIPKHLRSLFADIANSLIPNFDFSDNLEDTINLIKSKYPKSLKIVIFYHKNT